MFGSICGDVIGSAYEFNNTKDYNFTLFTGESDFTDDSVMTVAVASWLLKDGRHKQKTLEKSMLDLANKCPCPMGGYGQMFYLWLFNPSMLKQHTGLSGEKRHPYNSCGNGSAMRASACGWFFDTLGETESIAGTSAAITHNHPEGIKGAQATAAAIWMARNRKTKEEIKNYISSKYGYDLDRPWEYLNKTYSWDSCCQGSVPEAIISFLESDDFEDAIRKAVSIGGDSDTIACITGGIAEAYYGSIPSRISEKVWALLPGEFHDIIKEMASKTVYGDCFKSYKLGL